MTTDNELLGAGRRTIAGRSRARRREGGLPSRVTANAVLIVLSLLSAFPLYWAVVTSFQPAKDINSGVQRLWPANPTVENYVELFVGTGFWRAVLNSVVITGVVAAFGTLFAAAAGYAFAKLHFRGRRLLFTLLLITIMVPSLVTVPVNFIVMAHLGLLDTYAAVILPQLAPAFGIFWMRQFALTAIPDSILEAAEIDGAGTLRTFWSVGLPMMRPGLAGLAVYLFMMAWNQFLLPLTYLQSNEMQTFTVFLSMLNTSFTAPKTNLALAASMMSIIPILVVFLTGQRHLVAGMTAGAVKG